MLVRLLTFLRQPYPVLDGPAAQFRRAGLIGLFVGGFLLVFQPFGLGEWQTTDKALKIGGFGLITLLVTLAWYVGWPAAAPGFFRENRWTVGRAAFFLNGNMMLIAAGNLLYLNMVQGTPINLERVTWMMGATFLLGLFPAVGTTVATYIQQLREHQARAAAVTVAPSSGPPVAPPGALPQAEAALLPNAATLAPPVTLTFTPDNGRDPLTLPTAAVLFLESADNYCTVVRCPATAGAPPGRTLLRAALSRLAAQAEAQASTRLVRVHRSYSVNLAHVVRVSGNAQGYRLHFGGVAAEVEAVPVGRTYAEAVLAALQAPANALPLAP